MSIRSTREYSWGKIINNSTSYLFLLEELIHGPFRMRTTTPLDMIVNVFLDQLRSIVEPMSFVLGRSLYPLLIESSCIHRGSTPL
jgi:hypothetical protein